MHVLRWITLFVATFAPLAASAGGEGLSTDADRVPWARFQGRISFTATAPLASTPVAPSDGTGLQVQGLSLMGDVYFGSAPAGNAKATAGGFRATSGVIVGTRNSLWGMSAMAPASGLLNVDRRLFGPSAPVLGYSTDPANDSSGTLPYLGIGYSSLAARSGWSFSADLGLVSLAPGNAVRLGRVFGGSQNLDDVVRDMRLTPVLQLGASYSF
ncbi:MAG: hypothetical protein K8R60_16685 [Burkholderiales bacterium]|nr:hypothetical protein [Burkholderiales bacterium]